MSRPALLTSKIVSTFQIRFKSKVSAYLTTDDRSLLKKQAAFPKLTSQIYVQNEEVKQNDGYSLIETSQQQPHELHLIKKIRTIVGEPWWIKKALKELGFKSYRNHEWDVVYKVQPNTTQINNLLMQVKHVVKILPVTFKNGYPVEFDVQNTRLNLETGEVEVVKKIDATMVDGGVRVFEIDGVKVTADLKTSSSFPLDKTELKSSLHRQRALGTLNKEYFPTVYDYKYGQDLPGVIQVKGRADTSVKEDEID